MIGLLGKKIGMTQVFNEQGQKVPVTVLEVGPCKVTDLRTKAKDGYSAVQLGFDEVKEKNQTRPRLGHFKKAKVKPVRFVREIRTEQVEGLSIGAEVSVDNFQPGEFVDIQGVSIGHGFQGVVKRHGMKGAQTKSHGSKHGREVGSIGMSATPARVFKGCRMPGQMGNKIVTTQNIQVIRVDQENSLMAVKGTVPGSKGSYLVIRAALKKSVERKWKVQSSKELSPKDAQPTDSQSSPKAAEAGQSTKPAEVSDNKSE